MARLIPLCLAVGLMLVPALAQANPCGFEEKARFVVKGYPTGGTAIPREHRDRLANFADTAKFRDGVCIFAQVDAQGSEAANRQVADRRAKVVRDFLIARGVPADVISLADFETSFTLFGLIPEDRQSNRRVMVTHN